MNRTYYVVEMHCPAYPVNELHVQSRPFADPLTAKHSYKVRATTKAEAEEMVRAMLTAERREALEETAKDNWPS